MTLRRILALLLASLAPCGPAHAHVSLEPAEAPAGGAQPLRFRIGHGCSGQATTQLRVEIPEALDQARPQPKPGWTLKIDHDGPKRVTAITWTGSLPDDQFDDFAILARLPAEPGPLYFPTVQTCGAEEVQWTGVPDPGESAHTLTHPAPSVKIVPATGPAEMHHH